MPKRTKSIKKGDIKQQKGWLKKVNPSLYEVETKSVKKTILIVAEGQTEKLYFESFPVLTLTVEVIDLGGQSKLKLIETTERLVTDSGKTYDEIWCVFDMDITRGEDELADFDNAIHQGTIKGYNIAYSNDAFELWFYLHFQYTDQQHLRTFYYEELGKVWGMNYEKEGKTYNHCLTIYDKLEKDEKASQEKAIERAEKLFLEQEELPYSQQNPITKVFELVQLLNSNKRN